MVSIKLQGGLGNQMYQIAFLYSYAKKHNLEYFLPLEVVNPHIRGKIRPYIFDKFIYSDELRPKYFTQEPGFNFFEFPKINDTTFVGYFQSWKYFDDETVKMFGLNSGSSKTSCGIHIRRGDYMMQQENHPFVGVDYIRSAMKNVLETTGIERFVVYSDDIEWCNKFFFYEEQYDIMTAHGDELTDLKHLSEHKFIIGSNSSFSIWAHLLNEDQDKKIWLPQTWFGPNLSHNDTSDMYPKGAIIL